MAKSYSAAAAYGVYVVRGVYCIVLIGWFLLIAVDHTNLEGKWGLWLATAILCLVENSWILKKSVMVRHLRHCDNDPRIRPLHKKKIRRYFKRRDAMLDIVDTLYERVRHAIHDNSVKLFLESRWKTLLKDKTGDAIGALESKIDWGVKWPPIGKQMHGRTLSFGDTMRSLYFDIGAGYLDVASVGLTPAPVHEGRHQWNLANQKNPVIWRFQSLPFRIKQGQSRIAAEVGSDPDDTVFVASAAEAVSCVVRGLPWQTGDRFLHLTAEGDEEQFVPVTQFAQLTYGVEAFPCKLPLPSSGYTILHTVEAVLQKQLKNQRAIPMPVLAIFAHCMPNGWVLPAKALTRLFHKYGISVVIDGTLALGQIPLEISQIGADWYTASLSSFFAFDGCGFLVTNPLKQSVTVPLTVSYFDGQGYMKEFSYYGLRDFSSWLSVIDAFDFVEKVCKGLPQVRKYCRQVAHLGELEVRKAWGDSFSPIQGSRPGKGSHVCLAPGRAGDACIRFQKERAVVLNDNFGDNKPFQVQGERGIKLWYAAKDIRVATQAHPTEYGLMPTFRIPVSKGLGAEAAGRLKDCLITDHGVTVHVFSAAFEQGPSYLYARCSVGIHNTVDDFRRFASAIMQMRGTY